VSPGTYTDTIHFTANSQSVKAIGNCPTQTTVTQADTTVVDFGSYTNCRVIEFKLTLTAPSSGRQLITGSGAFTAKLYRCFGSVTSTGAHSNYVFYTASVSAGAKLEFIRGKYVLTHSGSSAGAFKTTVYAPNNLNCEMTDTVVVVNASNSAAYTAGVIGTGGAFTLTRCDIQITDDGATNTAGFLNLATTDSLLLNNKITIEADNAGTAAGIIAPAASTIRSDYNAIKVTQDGAGTGYALYLVNGVTYISTFDELSSPDGILNSASTYNYVNSSNPGYLDVENDIELGGDITDGTNATSAAEIKDAYDHSQGDGSDHGDVASNTTHRTSNGTDHTYIDQDVTTTASPTFAGVTTTGEVSDGTYGGDVEDLATQAITFVVDGGGSAITTGVKGDLMIPFDCTIRSATLLADQSGSIVIDIWKDTYANYPPTDADSITASAPPTISSATKSQDTTLTGWTKTISKGETIRINVDSITTIQRVTLVLEVTKT